MAEFAPFSKVRPEGPSPEVSIGPLIPADVPACAGLAAEREGESRSRWTTAFETALGDPHQFVLVVRCGQDVVGYGKAAVLDPAAAGGRRAPRGWYLTGIVVDPAYRRRGIGRRLTRERLRQLAARGVDEVWFFANARNAVSLDLHENVGFVEVTRDFTVPGVEFEGGVGVLCRWRAPQPAQM